MADLQADLVSRLKGNGLTQASQGVVKLTRDVNGLTRSTSSLQGQSSATFGAMGRWLDGIEQKAAKTAKGFRKLHAGALAGPLKEYLGIAGLSAGLGPLGLAVAGVAIGFSLYSDHLEKNAEEAKAAAEANEELTKAITGAAKAANQRALSAAQSEGATFKQLNARGGQRALDEANQIARNPNLGIGSADAAAGINASYLLPEKIRQGAIAAALRAARTGEVGFPEAVKKIGEDPTLRSLLTSTADHPGNPYSVAKRLVVGARGQVASGANLAAAGDALDRSTSPQGQVGRIIVGANRAVAAASEGEQQTQADIAAGKGEAGARQDLIERLAPAAVILSERFAKLTEAIQEQNKLQREKDAAADRAFQSWQSGMNYMYGGARGIPLGAGK